MRKIYLLVQNDVRTGPFTIRELLQQSLHTESLVWVIGESEDWLSPTEIPSLKHYLISNSDGTFLLKEELLEDVETNEVENLPKENAVTRNGIWDTKIMKEQARNVSNNNAVSEEPNTDPTKTKTFNHSIKAWQKILQPKEPTESDEAYGLGEKKWPVLITISLMVLLILWSIIFNGNDRSEKQAHISQVSSSKRVLPEANAAEDALTNKQNNEVTDASLLPIVVPAVVTSANSSYSPSTDAFLDSVARVVESQEQLMAAVDVVYKKSFLYAKRSYKSVKSKKASPINNTFTSSTKTNNGRTNISLTSIQQQIDLQSRYIKNGSRQQLSGVEVMVKNNSKELLKTISVDVFYYKKGEQLLSKETVYFSNLYPRQSLTMSIPGNQKATSARMQIGNITLAQRQ